MLTSFAATHRRSSSSGACRGFTQWVERSVIQVQQLARNHGGVHNYAGRSISIASPPFEKELVFTTRMRDTAFKRSLKKVPLATEVQIGAAAGSFALHKNRAKPAVFLAGGIGITPFLSIMRQADRDRLPHKLYLFYSNRRPEDAAFLDTLQTLEKTNPNFRLICTMTEMSKSKKEWKGETVLIDKEMLSRHLTVLQGLIYYIARPRNISGRGTGLRTSRFVFGSV